jgi:hypothetical protein
MKKDLLIDYNKLSVEIIYLKNKTLNWYPSDTEELYLHNRKKLGKSWQYYNKDINYLFNDLGYRGPDPQDIIDNNFFITMGCSHTLGMGVPLNETYSHLLAENLNLKYLNFSTGGGSQNLLWTNTCLLVKNLKFVPRFVVCQWPELERYNSFGKDVHLIANPHGHFDSHPKLGKLYRALLEEEYYFYNSARTYFETVNIMWNFLGVKVINFTLCSESKDLFNIKYFNPNPSDPKEKARDLHHPGLIHHKEYCDYVLSQLF